MDANLDCPPSPPPLPFLPLELKHKILRLCDRSTLAKTSSVSFAFLQLSGPLLYTHITIEGPVSLWKMRRFNYVDPAIQPFLSLSQTSSFTYVPSNESTFLGLNPPPNNEDGPPRDHLLSYETFPISVLYLNLSRLVHNPSTPAVQLPNLLSSFNPSRFVVHGANGLTGTLSILDLEGTKDWNRLERIRFNRARPCKPHLHGSHLVVQAPDEGPGLDVTFDLRRLTSESLKIWVWDEIRRVGETGKLGKVKVWLDTKKEKDDAKERLVGLKSRSLRILVTDSVSLGRPKAEVW